MELLKIQDLKVRFPARDSHDIAAVDGVSLSVNEGSIVGIVGESGSGKSLTLSSCLQLVPRPGRITEGSIRFRGQELIGLPESEVRKYRGTQIAMILQDPMTSLHPSLTIGRQVANAIRDHQKLSKSETKARVLEALSMADIPHPAERLKAYPHQLSGGLRQRVMIALAIVNRPALLLADEPTTALDVTVQAQILAVLRKLNEETGLSIVLVTHNFGLVAGFCERTLVMRNGQVIDEGPTQRLFRHPGHAYTRALLDAVPRVDVATQDRSGTVTGNDPLIRCEGVSKEFHSAHLTGGVTTVQALDRVSLDVYRGETLGLVGESGSGKTTLARSILRLEDVSAGTISYDGRDITHLRGADLRSLRRKMQMVFQDPYSSLNPRMTVRDIVGEPIRLHQLCSRDAIPHRIEELLEMVGLPQRLAERYPMQLSGGERQRVGIARALAVEPEVIVADEPVSALDVTIQAQITDLFARLRKELNLTLIVVAHDLGLVRRMCDRVAVMYLGRLAEVGEAESLFQRPRHPYTLALLRAAPRLDVNAGPTQQSQLLIGERPSSVRPPSGCRFHPRCWKASALCAERTPEMTEAEASASFACFHPLNGEDEISRDQKCG